LKELTNVNKNKAKDEMIPNTKNQNQYENLKRTVKHNTDLCNKEVRSKYFKELRFNWKVPSATEICGG
jgi:hypothetical protein